MSPSLDGPAFGLADCASDYARDARVDAQLVQGRLPTLWRKRTANPQGGTNHWTSLRHGPRHGPHICSLSSLSGHSRGGHDDFGGPLAQSIVSRNASTRRVSKAAAAASYDGSDESAKRCSSPGYRNSSAWSVEATS